MAQARLADHQAGRRRYPGLQHCSLLFEHAWYAAHAGDLKAAERSLVTLRENSSFEEDYQPGDLVEFNAPGGGKYAGVLKEVGETSALFDFNHPLAGQTILFEVQLIGIL